MFKFPKLNPEDIPSSKKEWIEAFDRQFPPKTEQERADYYARRDAFLAKREPLWHVGLQVLLIAAIFIGVPLILRLVAS